MQMNLMMWKGSQKAALAVISKEIFLLISKWKYQNKHYMRSTVQWYVPLSFLKE